MRRQLAHYLGKLAADGSADPRRTALLARDDVLLSVGAEDLATLGGEILERLNAVALVLATPTLPFADLLAARTSREERSIIPRDTETRTFLHDIPLLRRSDPRRFDAAYLAQLLGRRKGIAVEGLGILAVGGVTVEQAYINYSSVFHAVFVKFLLDLLQDGPRQTDELAALRHLEASWPQPDAGGLDFHPGPFNSAAEVLAEIAAVGRHTVERRLVDSFFGNISCRLGDTLFISQTAASLDALPGCIDPVPFDDSSTVGLTASSELPAHRRIYELTEAKTILHGHPKFTVVMSMLCEQGDCSVSDCWRDCPQVRMLGGTPVVAGEIGAGGLAKRVPPVIGETGSAIVYGHGVFAVGEKDFGHPFRAMVEVERWCRAEYFRRLHLLHADIIGRNRGGWP
jgi:ribulose-5-phosphate 4-epimerase/fuculose-1-phosphate aldolase